MLGVLNTFEKMSVKAKGKYEDRDRETRRLLENIQDLDMESEEFSSSLSPQQLQHLRGRYHELRGEYCDKKPLKLFVGTWNVLAREPPDDLANWFTHETNTSDDEPCDLYALGLQEFIELKPGAVASSMFVGSDFQRSNWEVRLSEALPREKLAKGEKYKLVVSEDMVGIALFVFVRSSISPYISRISTDTVPCGMMGVLGNKGGVATRIRIFDSDVCFVNSHLASGKKNIADRNANYATISERISFPRPPPDTDPLVPVSLLDHDMVFWFGDLNYRLNFDTHTQLDEVHERVRNGDLRFLLEKDQLISEMKKSAVFQGFREHDITFIPSYKYIPGREWDLERREGEKIRMPAWCDRILVKDPLDRIRCRYYDIRTRPFVSDHKAVFALFDVQLEGINTKRLKKSQDHLRKQLDDLENKQRPAVKIRDNDVHFGDVYFNEPKLHTVTLKNPSRRKTVRVVFRNLNQYGNDRCCPPWVQVHPTSLSIRPREKVEIHVQICINLKTIIDIDQVKGNPTLEEVLVLEVRGGADHFIPINAVYQRSCFGCSLDYLASLKEPARLSTSIDGDLASRTQSQGRVPKEMWRCVDYLYKNALDDPTLFQCAGSHYKRVREALDLGEDFPEDTKNDEIANLLIGFLESLETPILPREFLSEEALKAAPDAQEFFVSIMEHQRPVQRSSLLCITSFMNDCLDHASKNNLSIEALVSAFVGPLTRTAQPSLHYDTARFVLCEIMKALVKSHDSTAPQRRRVALRSKTFYRARNEAKSPRSLRRERTGGGGGGGA